jgi:hypothetical protein
MSTKLVTRSYKVLPMRNNVYGLDSTVQYRTVTAARTEILGQCSRLVLDTSRVDLATFLGAASTGLLSVSLSRLTVGDFSQPVDGTSTML